MILYTLADYGALSEHETIETFSTREEAEEERRAVLADEPEWGQGRSASSSSSWKLPRTSAPACARRTRLADEQEVAIRVVSRRLIEDVTRLPGIVAEKPARRPIGFALLRFDDDDAEVVVLQSLEPGRGAGTALLEAARADAEQAGCRRVWLVTTNDNLHALRFYQRRGWDWVAMHPDAVVESRRLKPEISLLGAHHIPIRHELEFELALDARPPEP